MKQAVVALLLSTAALGVQHHTRGVGVYPGDPAEDAAPIHHVDSSTYRNLARHRPAFHSSSYDYNLTAQLVTDGILADHLPRWVGVATSGHKTLPKHQREWLLDGNWVSSIDLQGSSVWVEFELGGGPAPLTVTRLQVEGRVQSKRQFDPENWTCTVAVSDDGRTWVEAGRVSGMTRSGGDFNAAVTLTNPVQTRRYRLTFDDPRAAGWQLREVQFDDGDRNLRIGGPHDFTSAWMSAGAGDEWIRVDLGAPAAIERLTLRWLRRPAKVQLQVSDDAVSWRDLAAPGGTGGALDEVSVPGGTTAQHVRAAMSGGLPRQSAAEADGEGGRYVLTEFEVHGRGGLVPRPQPAGAAQADGRLELSRGRWKVQRDSLVAANGPVLSTTGYDDGAWMVATVPGTVLASYLNAGALPDPNVGDNQLMISDSFFHADFWYRNEFRAPAAQIGRRWWLQFDGVNRNAEVFLNGQRLGRIEGGFVRGRFDVTERLRPGEPNALAVRIEKVAHPGSIKEKTFESIDKNGGAIGADSPTYVASIGWDWIPTIRGRNTGIWNGVHLSATGPVTLGDPLVTTTMPLPDITAADVRVETTLHNHSKSAVTGRLRGRYGEVAFDVPVSVDAAASTNVTLDPATFPALRLRNPRVWWPVGYGEPHLYDVEVRFETADGAASDVRRFKSGVRQITSEVADGTLRLWINGRRLIPRGGSWGFSESMLRYRAREYDAALRYHRDMNFNMIRNWVGQVGDEELYEAADRHGVVIWQDFWLANPWDGPDPASDETFIRNATDLVNRIRTHPSVALYCGRNEGYPPQPLDEALRRIVKEHHPGLPYISSSADDVVSGHGPYQAMPLDFYFTQRATPKIHSEMGMPNIPTLESLRLMMPESSLWPHGAMWGVHDLTLQGAQGGRGFLDRVEKSYGAADSVRDWVWLAQFVNYEGYRAMFEAQSRHRMGLLLWMSHPAWPSMVWQTYDYYFDPTAAYFGSKKGSEPLHIQWNPVTEDIEVVNYSGGNHAALTASAQLVNADGLVVWQKSTPIDSAEDSTALVFRMEYPENLSPVHFLRLRLSRGSAVLSENFYWRGTQPEDYRALRSMSKASVEVSTSGAEAKGEWTIRTTIRNVSSTPAIMLRATAIRERSRDRILPALYSDNYLWLMPREARTIVIQLRQADARGERPAVIVDGFNVGQVTPVTNRRSPR